MRISLRPVARLLCLLSLALLVAVPSRSSAETVILDSVALAQLEMRAQAAQPREQCFLYTELVQHLTEVAGQQIAAGDTEHASATLQRIDAIAQKIHGSVASDAKKLKSAEMMLHSVTHRLTDIMHITASGDRERVTATLKRLDAVHNEILAQVFAR